MTDYSNRMLNWLERPPMLSETDNMLSSSLTRRVVEVVSFFDDLRALVIWLG